MYISIFLNWFLCNLLTGLPCRVVGASDRPLGSRPSYDYVFSTLTTCMDGARSEDTYCLHEQDTCMDFTLSIAQVGPSGGEYICVLHMCVHACIHTYTDIHVHACRQTCRHAYRHIHMHTYICICGYISECVVKKFVLAYVYGCWLHFQAWTLGLSRVLH